MVILVGHLGANPEIQRTKDLRAIASFSIATGESWKDKATGERRERPRRHLQ
jgi:single-strand DNA-binding protein